MSHHLRYFRFSNRTHIEMNDDLQMEQFFREDDGMDMSDNLRIPGPIRSRPKPENTAAAAAKKK